MEDQSKGTVKLDQHLQELLRFIKETNAKKRIEGFNELAKLTIFPTLVPSIDYFIAEILVQVIQRSNDQYDSVRVACMNCLFTLIKQLGTKNFDSVLATVLPTLFNRIKSENCEEVLVAILNILVYFVDLTGVETVPSTWDEYARPTIIALATSCASNAPDVKLLSAQILETMCGKIARSMYREVYDLEAEDEAKQKINYSEALINALLKNIVHRNKDIRKQTLQALAKFYVITTSEYKFDSIATLLEQMIDDRILSVRLAVVDYVKTLLVQHDNRHMYYSQYLPILLTSIYSLVPVRKITEDEVVKQPEVTKQAYQAWKALDAIGKQHEVDKKDDYAQEKEYIGPTDFDEKRKICVGLRHILQDNYKQMMDHLIPKLIEWTEQIRVFGLRAVASLIQLTGQYSVKTVVDVMKTLGQSIKTIRGDQEFAMRVAAILASNVNEDDLIAPIVSNFTNEGPREIVLLLQVALVNAKFSDGGLASIIDGINNNRVFDALDCINNLAEAVLALIVHANENFRDVNSNIILITILRIGEKGDAMHYFENCFGRPLATVFSEQMQNLLRVTDKSSGYLSKLLLKVPPYAIQNNLRDVCQAICESIAQSEQEGTKELMDLITTLCYKGAITDITEQLFDLVINKMEWSIGKENVPPREAATLALAALLKSDAITQERCDESLDKILPAVLSALDDSWSDPVRVAAIALAREFIAKSNKLNTKFSEIYKAIRERMDDHVLSVRVNAVSLMADFLVKCSQTKDQIPAETPATTEEEKPKDGGENKDKKKEEIPVKYEDIPKKFEDLLVFIDDMVKEVREAMEIFCERVGSVEEWKEPLSTTLKSVIQNNNHDDATELANKALEKLGTK
ncbi:hypothetical protein TVAG_189530 [Trichomonas vaginalis G3]|uniref:Dynein axonemal assembly factor 5 TPR repeats domain-containing protein n=1 Tax=Trichomonas vaginalis (strain ATCC PRA-98 / G3) TaxID=412133 RepID=A2F1Q7_TRIV3|nr:dynein assembly factor 5, axonemal family [Trichomonas vaginalis G3]EAY01167.1 hypothetical protein TVAG_189530 [Trichomonas vaginalis G3]KAI5547177.1 dynein assembly factor 5, axonemal family [Trichomonas vaginalis G3]|eukprot:XP_001330114.1 hypothetical protein [Trichomonas vaginalis G3]